MSGQERKLKRQAARKHSTGAKMEEQTKKPATLEKPIERKFSKAQMRRFNELQGEVSRSQAELQKFTNYLADEHEINEDELPEGYSWIIGRNGFVTQAPDAPPPTPPTPPDNSAQPPSGSEETQTPPGAPQE